MTDLNGKEKLNRITQLERKGIKTPLSGKEMLELASLYHDTFGYELTEDIKQIYR